MCSGIASSRITRALREQRGFTLTELLAVMAILGILAGLVAAATTGLGDSSQKTRLAGDRATIGTAVDRFFNLSSPQRYPVLRFDETDPALTTAGDLGVREVDFEGARLPQDPGQSFVPDFLKDVPASAAIVSWRIDTVRGTLFAARDGSQLVKPAESRLDVTARDTKSLTGISAYVFDLTMKKNEAAITALVIEIPEKYVIGGQGLSPGTVIGTLVAGFTGDNPWDPSHPFVFNGTLTATGVDDKWELSLDYPNLVNVPARPVPSRSDKVHRITVVRPSVDTPGRLTIEMDRSGESTEHNLANETWELVIFGSLQGGGPVIIANPGTPGVYRWLAQEATTIDPEGTFDDVAGKQSIILK